MKRRLWVALALLAGCSGAPAEPSHPGTVSVPIPLAVGDDLCPQMEAELVVDDGAPQPLTIDCATHTVAGTIERLAPGAHTFTLNYYLAYGELRLLVASGSSVAEIRSGETTEVGFDPDQFAYTDSDHDGVSDLREIALGTDPFDDGSQPEDTEAPSAPATLNATAASDTRIDLSWSAATDNVEVAGYTVFRDGAAIATVTETTYSDTERTPDTQYCYEVTAQDAAGNASAPSGEDCATTLAAPDTEAPTAPADLVATAASISRIDLSWSAATDNVEVVSYTIYRDGVPINTVADTHASDGGLAPDTSYCYQVTANDRAGNESEPSGAACERTDAIAPPPDTEAPTAPRNLDATASGTRIDLSWSAATDNVGVASYTVYRDGEPIQTVFGTTTSDDDRSPLTQYCYRVTASDATGNESQLSNEACATTGVVIDPP